MTTRIVLGFLIVMFCIRLFAGEPSTIGPATPPSAAYKHVKATWVGAFDQTGLAILAIGTAATLVAFNQDKIVHDNWVNYQRMESSVAAFGNFWGTGIPEVTIAAGQLILDNGNGIFAAEGLVGAALTTYALKFITQRARPDSNTKNSFPSGHTQVAFASATSLLMAYGWRAGVPAYALGVLTGLSRLADNAHWLSDVVAGSAIGILFGRAGFEHHFGLQPLVIEDGGRGGGIVASWKF